MYEYVGTGTRGPHDFARGSQYPMAGNRGMQTPAVVRQHQRDYADSSPHSAAYEDASSQGVKGVGGCCAPQGSSSQSARSTMD